MVSTSYVFYDFQIHPCCLLYYQVHGTVWGSMEELSLVGRGVRNKAKYVGVTRRGRRRGKIGIPSYNLIRRGRVFRTSGRSSDNNRRKNVSVCVCVKGRREREKTRTK